MLLENSAVFDLICYSGLDTCPLSKVVNEE